MVRPADGVDLGLWTRLDPARLVMPVDRHVQRIAPLIGLVPRADGSWRSAVAITRALAALCPEDPVRYDFALAHLGISDGCRGAFHADVCPGCPVRPVCVQGALSAAPPADRKAAPRRATRR
jgi:endonuclease III